MLSRLCPLAINHCIQDIAQVIGMPCRNQRSALTEPTLALQENIEQLVEQPDCRPAAWAVVKGAVGLLLPPTETHDWSTMRSLVSKSVLQAAMAMEADAVE